LVGSKEVDLEKKETKSEVEEDVRETYFQKESYKLIK